MREWIKRSVSKTEGPQGPKSSNLFYSSNMKDKLQKQGEEVKQLLIDGFSSLFVESLIENNFDECDKVIAAYQNYKRGFQIVEKL